MMKQQTSSNGEAVLWTPREAAEKLAIGERTLRRLTADGKIPHVRIGRLVHYIPDDVREWVKAQRIPAKEFDGN